MNIIEIRHKYTKEIIFFYSCENNTIKLTVEEAIEQSVNLSYADLRFANLSNADLRFANLSYADLSNADLSNADLRFANLSYADLSYADLSNADLSYADLSNANLRFANLSNADLRFANLSYADLRFANLSYADLRFANLSNADHDNLIVFYGMKWPIYINKYSIQIGCQIHSIESWLNFNDEEIHSMHNDALKFWKENKDLIFLAYNKLKL